jgi:hypothetical protein
MGASPELGVGLEGGPGGGGRQKQVLQLAVGGGVRRDGGKGRVRA